MADIRLSRRDFLKTSAVTAALFGLPAWAEGLDELPPPSYGAFSSSAYPAGWTPPSDLATVDPAVLVLNRIAFGPRPADYDRVKQIGVDSYIEEQLSPEAIDDSTMDALLKSFTTLTMSAAQLGQLYGEAVEQQRLNRLLQSQGEPTDTGSAVQGFIGLIEQSGGAGSMDLTPQQTFGRLIEIIQATVLRQMFSTRQLYEVMVDFWSNHFNIYILKNQDRYLKTVDDREVIRKNALGSFRDLIFASAHSPAMLAFLDNVSNVKGVPNENYARELMELHTISVEAGYTQADVQEVARAFTGWGVTAARPSLLGPDYQGAGEFSFRPNQHDQGEKLVLGMKIPAGGDVRDGEQVLDLLAGHPKTAQFVSTKLVRRLVADEPPASLVQKTVTTFQQTNGDIKSVLSTILHSDEFKQSFGQKGKRPLEYIASAVRALDARVEPNSIGSTPANPKQANGTPKAQEGAAVIANALRTMGQVPFNWEAPNGYPDAATAWINSNNMLARWNLALALTSGGAPGLGLDLEQIPRSFTV